MLDSTFVDRYSRLLDTRLIERAQQFPVELSQIAAKASQSGMFHSSVHASQVHQAHQRELEVRTIIAWQSLVRTHRTLGTNLDQNLRTDLKAELASRISSFGAGLSQSLQQQLQRLPMHQTFSLAETQQHLVQKHEIEVDFYVDSLMSNNSSQPPATQQYNFYGSIGAVQTGANAQANVVQNIGAEDRAALTQSLSLVREALQHAEGLAERQQQELLEIAAECEAQVASDSPNNTKLLTMFTVLGTAVQSIASARPAYQALKTALLPLGITLP